MCDAKSFDASAYRSRVVGCVDDVDDVEGLSVTDILLIIGT